jgi:lysophospholipase L1-like esterase
MLLANFAGCERSNHLSTSPLAEKSILSLGDSYTIGEGVKELERWPVQLAELARGKGYPATAPIIIARTGWTIDELHTAVTKVKPRGPFHLITLMAGVNDQFRGRNAESCRGAFRSLLTDAVNLAGNQPSRVIVISIPDWGATPFAAGRDNASIAAEIDQFNRVQREEAAAAGARYVDVTAISREVNRDPSLLAADQLHPSGAMYRRWADAILPSAIEALAK